MGDFNINLMKINSESDKFQFYDTICSYFFMPFVLQPTRVTDKWKNLINNFFSIVLNSLPCLITLRIQSLTTRSSFVILEDFITSKPPPKSNVYKRNFDNFDSNELKEDLRKIDWINEILKSSNDINEIFDVFTKLLVT